MKRYCGIFIGRAALAALALMLPAAAGLLAQPYPITILNVSVAPPYSPYLSDWERNPDRVNVTLRNTSATPYDVRLSGFAENLDGSVRVETKDDFAGARRVTIGPNAVLTVNARATGLFDVNAVRFKGTSSSSIKRSGQLPEGTYRVCIRALDYNNPAIALSQPDPPVCSNIFTIRYIDEPRPITPACGSVVASVTKPQFLTFQWIAPEAPAGTVYDFVMVEIPDGRSAEDALKSAPEPPLFRRIGLVANSLVYTAADPALVQGRRYAWRVTARDMQNRVVFRRNGVGPACEFTYGSRKLVIGDTVGRGGGPDTVIGGKDPFGGGKDPFNDGKGPYLDDKLFAECFTLTPETRFGDGSVRPLFVVHVDPSINFDAVRGGRLEIWQTEGKGEDPNAVVRMKERRVFAEGFTGSPAKALRYERGKAAPGLMELLFVNAAGAQYEFRPKENAEYIWRFTLDYDPRTVRADGAFCARASVSSSFGRIRDIIRRPNLPDTLLSGGFTIVVEEWDATSRSDDRSRPSGIGRVKFDCNRTTGLTPWRDFRGVLPRGFDVVPTLSDSAAQFSLDEARLVDPAAIVGERIDLLLPADRTSRFGAIVDRNIFLDFYRRRTPEGIRVAFRDVRWEGPVRPTVTLVEGIAVYPSPTPVPTPPAEVRLDSAFSLAIDSLTILPSGATVRGGILLPTSVISAATCTRARVELPETPITPDCELYRDVAGDFGRFFIGNTEISISGRGYTVDFSRTRSRSGVGDMAWRGVVLDTGSTPGPPPDTVTSNRGYVYAQYRFNNLLVTQAGLEGRLLLAREFTYKTLEPYGYRIVLPYGGSLTLRGSALNGGRFENGSAYFPRAAVRDESGTTVRAIYRSLEVQPNMDVKGSIEEISGSALQWGEFSSRVQRAYQLEMPGRVAQGLVYFSARHRSPFYPLAGETFATFRRGVDPAAHLDERGIQGITFPLLRERALKIFTADKPDRTTPLEFPAQAIDSLWLNVGRAGVHGEIALIENRDLLRDRPLGPTYLTRQYRGETELKTSFGVPFTPDDQKLPPKTKLQFVESAVWEMGLRGDIVLGGPINASVRFRRMMFTSTAECGGGHLMLDSAVTMDYWGVQLVGRTPGRSAGLVCAKTGVIYTTAAGIAERRHFSEPFYLSWGEIRASGNLGRLVLDRNSRGQRFDRFNYAPERLALSNYSPAVLETLRDTTVNAGRPLRGYLHTFGAVSIGFFGAKKMSISDYRVDGVMQRSVDSGAPGSPRWVVLNESDGRGGWRPVIDTVRFGAWGYNNPVDSGRWVRVRESEHLGVPPSELRWRRDWAGDLGTLDFGMHYDSLAQDGFFGRGEIGLRQLRGAVGAFMNTRAEGSCFRMIGETSLGFDMAHIGNAGMMANAWGCGCIVGESLERIAFGGELSAYAGGLFNMARTGSMASVLMSVTPTQAMFEVNGDFYVTVMDLNAQMTGMASFIVNYDEGYIAGALKGRLDLGSFVGGVSGEGEFDWHLSPPVPGLTRDPYQFIQGRVGVHIYALAVGAGLEAGVFLGINAPKERAWVMSDMNGRFGVNMAMLPDRLTGFYAYLSQSSEFNVLIVSGGYRVYVGVGAFDGTVLGVTPIAIPGSARPGGGPVTASVLGNVGVLVYGKILGGLLSVGGWVNLQMLAGLPPAFHGVIGLEACALWVLCGSVDVHCGFNTNQGFYIY